MQPHNNGHIYTYLDRPLTASSAEEIEATKHFLHTCSILVIGAGGLGCELLKNLALSGFTDIHLIDLDVIDVSNLNRQFLFRTADIGRSKAQVAAEFIMKRVPACRVTPYFGRIQDKTIDYYIQFSIIICGLDSVDARRWISATILGMYDPDDSESIIPIIDGGTEGFKGQARVIVPKLTACYECSLDLQTKPTTYPVCTIANTPRLPEHCIEYALTIQWGLEFKDKVVDGDDPAHITWIMQTAITRASTYGISGITYSLTQGVVKNVIPAIASTNAIIAAACSNEAFKMATNSAANMNNYMMYTADSGVYTYTFELLPKPECIICGNSTIFIKIPIDLTLAGLVTLLIDEHQLKRPSLSTPSKSLYMQAPKSLQIATSRNLEVRVAELLDGGGEDVIVTDENLPVSIRLVIEYV